MPGDFREVLQRRLGELERQLLRKVSELEDEKSLLHNESSAHRQKTESALNALLQRVSELERGGCQCCLASLSPARCLSSLQTPHPLVQSAGGQAERGQPGAPLPMYRQASWVRDWLLPDPHLLTLFPGPLLR